MSVFEIKEELFGKESNFLKPRYNTAITPCRLLGLGPYSRAPPLLGNLFSWLVGVNQDHPRSTHCISGVCL